MDTRYTQLSSAYTRAAETHPHTVNLLVSYPDPANKLLGYYGAAAFQFPGPAYGASRTVIAAWCEQQFGEQSWNAAWNYHLDRAGNQQIRAIFYFREYTDAVVFKLRWGN